MKWPKKLCLIALLMLMGCSQKEAPAQTRGVGTFGDAIVIGVPWPFAVRKDHFRQGVEMAAADINAAGGVLGRPLELVFADDGGKASTGKLVAQQFAQRTEMVAVLGHYDTHIAEPASLTYQYNGLLFMTPGDTHSRLTEQGFDLVFRTIPSDTQIGGQLAEMAKRESFQRVAIIHEQSNYGHQLANAIEFRCEEIGLEVVDRLSYENGVHDYRTLFSRLHLLECDALFFAGLGSDACALIKAARDDGFRQPFLGANGLDTQALFGQGAEAIEGVQVLSVFDSENPSPYVQCFNNRFESVNGSRPDAWAAQGYDLIQLFAHGLRRAQSTNPMDIALALKSVHDWHGITGSHSFDQNGEVIGKPMVVKVAHSGKLVFQSL